MQLDRDVEDEWLLLDQYSSSSIKAGPQSNLDEQIAENSVLNGRRVQDEPDALDQIGAFFRRSSTRVVQTIDETDFRGGA